MLTGPGPAARPERSGCGAAAPLGMENEPGGKAIPCCVPTRRQGTPGEPVPKGCSSQRGDTPTLPELHPPPRQKAPLSGTAHTPGCSAGPGAAAASRTPGRPGGYLPQSSRTGSCRRRLPRASIPERGTEPAWGGRSATAQGPSPPRPARRGGSSSCLASSPGRRRRQRGRRAGSGSPAPGGLPGAGPGGAGGGCAPCAAAAARRAPRCSSSPAGAVPLPATGLGGCRGKGTYPARGRFWFKCPRGSGTLHPLPWEPEQLLPSCHDILAVGVKA